MPTKAKKLSDMTNEERFGQNPVAMGMLPGIEPVAKRFAELEAEIKARKAEHIEPLETQKANVKADLITRMADFADASGDAKSIWFPGGLVVTYTAPGVNRKYDWKQTDSIAARLQIIKSGIQEQIDLTDGSEATDGNENNPFKTVVGAHDIATLIGDIAAGKENVSRLNEVVAFMGLLTEERDKLRAKLAGVEAKFRAIDTNAQGLDQALTELAEARSETSRTDTVTAKIEEK